MRQQGLNRIYYKPLYMINFKGKSNVSEKRNNRARSILIKKQVHHANLESSPYLDVKIEKPASLRLKLPLKSSHSSSQQKSKSSSWENISQRQQRPQLKCEHKLSQTQINIMNKIQSLKTQLTQLKEQKTIKERYLQKLQILGQISVQYNENDMVLAYSKQYQIVKENLWYAKEADEDISHRIRTHQQQLRYHMDSGQDVLSEEVTKLRYKIATLEIQLILLKDDKRTKEKEAVKLKDQIQGLTFVNDNAMIKLHLKCQSIVYQKLNAIEKNIHRINLQIVGFLTKIKNMLKKELNIID